MPEDADFNDYKTNKWYRCNGTNLGQVNIPHSGDNGFLLVFTRGGSVRQIWIGVYAGALKTRFCSSGTWSEWKSFVLEQ